MRLGSISVFHKVYPVAFPPGRLKLSTSPALIGSRPMPNTMGIVAVACLAAIAAPPTPAITATPRFTRSDASAGSFSY